MSNPSNSRRPLTPSKEAHIAIDLELSEPIPKEVSATAHPVHSDSDVEGLANVQRIRRLFDFSKLFWFSLTFMSTWVGMNTSVCLRTVPTQANRNSNMFFALYNGGPQTFAWSIVIVYFGAVSQAASIAEMASIVPIAGAQVSEKIFGRLSCCMLGTTSMSLLRQGFVPLKDIHTSYPLVFLIPS